MRELIAIVKNESEIKTLKTAFKLAGADAFFVNSLNEAFDLIEKTNPDAVFISENTDPGAEIGLRELKRHSPSLSCVILASKRDSSAAADYIRKGALEVIQYPWTFEDISSAFKKARGIPASKIEFSKRKKILWPVLSVLTALTLTAILFSYKSGKEAENKRLSAIFEKKSVSLSDQNSSGIFFDSEYVYVYNWLLQTVFKHSKNSLEAVSAKKIPGKIFPIVADASSNALFFSDDSFLENRIKDEKMTLISSNGPFKKIDHLCFDGMYVWSASDSENILEQRLNNSSLETIRQFSLKTKKISAFACSNKNFFYYKQNEDIIEIAPINDPQKTDWVIKNPFNGEIISLGFDKENLWAVYKNKQGAYLAFEKLKLPKNQ